MKLCIPSILLALSSVGFSLNAYGVSDLKSSSDIFSRISGVWCMERSGADCKSKPSKYEFGDDNKTMSIISNKQLQMYDGPAREVVNYKVISNDDASITLAMENETRINKNGILALWKIVLINDNKFYWQISGEPKSQWGPVVKCVN